jgi:hypothetical protein
MPKPKRKLTARQRAEKKLRAERYMTIFIHGKQKRVLRPSITEGVPEEEFLLANADPIWLHQEVLWHLMPENCEPVDPRDAAISPESEGEPRDDEIPF